MLSNNLDRRKPSVTTRNLNVSSSGRPLPLSGVLKWQRWTDGLEASRCRCTRPTGLLTGKMASQLFGKKVSWGFITKADVFFVWFFFTDS